jgi:hypothetical protein
MTEFNYVPSEPPAPRNGSGGRGPQSQNPHHDIIDAISGTGRTLMFELDAPDDPTERRKLRDRHSRWLRNAAAAHHRGIRLWHADTPTGRIQVTFQDREASKTRGRKPATGGGEQIDGQLDITTQPQQTERPTLDNGAGPPAQQPPMIATFQG